MPEMAVNNDAKNRGGRKRIPEPFCVLLFALRRKLLGKRPEAATRMGLHKQTVEAIESGEVVALDSICAYLDALGNRIGPEELWSGVVPRFEDVWGRPPSTTIFEQLVASFQDAPLDNHELANVITVRPSLVVTQDLTSRGKLAKRFLDVGRTYNEDGYYFDAVRSFTTSATCYHACRDYDNELAALTQAMIASWTSNISGVTMKARNAFEQAYLLVTSKLPLSPAIVGNAVAGIACGTFHFDDAVTEKLLKLALGLFDTPEYGAHFVSLVDPRLATERREAHLLGRTKWDHGIGTLKDIMARSKGDKQGLGNTAICIACLMEERARQSGSKKDWRQLIAFLEDPVNGLDRASKWVRRFSGLGLGRLHLKLGNKSKGSELIEEHLPAINLSKFAPGRPMADRNKYFFLMEPLSDQEKTLFESVEPCGNSRKFPIENEKLGEFIAAVEHRFAIASN